MIPILALLALLAPQTAAPAAPLPPLRRISIPLEDAASLRRLRELDLDLVSVARGGQAVRAAATDEDLARLRAHGIDFTVEIEDLEAWYADRIANDLSAGPEAPMLGSWLSPPFGQGSMGGYYTFDEVVSVMNQIRSAFPSIVSAPQSIGTSLEGRTLWAFSVSDNPGTSEGEPTVRIDSLHHAREPEGMQALLWYVLYLVEGHGSDPLVDYLVSEREQWFVPVVNPDGYVWNQTIAPGGGGMWRKNRRNNGNGTVGVDLNRNYDYQWGYDNAGSSGTPSSVTYRGPSPASEPAVAAMQAFAAARDFDTSVSLHTYSNLWLRPYGYDSVLSPNEAELSELADLETETNRYLSIHGVDLYPANGTTIDYDHGVHGTYAWSPEIGRDGDGFWPVPSRIVPMAEENRVGLLRSALAAGTYLRITSMQVSDVGDGDGFVEAGETAEVEVTLRNSGRSGTGTSVVGTLTTASPLATAGAGSFDFGPIGSFANAGNPGSPLTLAIDPSAQPGDEIPYRLELAADGTVFPIELVLVVGRRFDYVDDPLEIDLGWTVGDPSDTATTGIWELADPIATDYQGEPLNPGEDAGAGAETQCFVTGNGGGSSGTDDVDGGTTTLYSPPFDLSAATVAYAGYSRWWANLAFNDDSMRVEVTGDGGGSWVLLEEIVNTQNAWTPAEFRLNDFVALTADVQLRFLASDGGSGSLTEAGVDDFSLSIYDDRPRLAVYGSQTTGTPVALNLTGEPGDAYAHLWSPGTGVLPLPGITGDFLLDPLQFFVPFQGTIPASGTRERILPIPPDPTLVGATVWWQSLVTGASETWLTNREPMTFD